MKLEYRAANQEFKLRKLDIENNGFVGQVEFMPIPYLTKNSYYEIFLNGSGSRTIKENFANIKHFKNHRITEAPAVIESLRELDGVGIIAISNLIDTTLGRDTYVEYITKQITQHSFGFNYVKDKVKWSDEDEALYVSDFNLYEVSSLNSWGASQNTPVLSLNNLDPKDLVRFNLVEMYKNENIVDKILGAKPKVFDFGKFIEILEKS